MSIDQCIAAVKQSKKEPPHQLRRLFMVDCFPIESILKPPYYLVACYFTSIKIWADGLLKFYLSSHEEANMNIKTYSLVY